MKIQMEPTSNIVELDGVECRIWIAVTDKNTHCLVFVNRIAVIDGEADEEFSDLFDCWKDVNLKTADK